MRHVRVLGSQGETGHIKPNSPSWRRKNSSNSATMRFHALKILDIEITWVPSSRKGQGQESENSTGFRLKRTWCKLCPTTVLLGDGALVANTSGILLIYKVVIIPQTLSTDDFMFVSSRIWDQPWGLRSVLICSFTRCQQASAQELVTLPKSYLAYGPASCWAPLTLCTHFEYA